MNFTLVEGRKGLRSTPFRRNIDGNQIPPPKPHISGAPRVRIITEGYRNSEFYPGLVIFSGRTRRSNSSAETKPSRSASSFNVVPLAWAVLATLAALS